MSVRYFSSYADSRTGYESCSPAGALYRDARALMSPIAASRLNLHGVQRLNIAADTAACARLLPTQERQYRQWAAEFAEQFTSSAVPRGERWWAPGGARPVQPVLQTPGAPEPPLVDDN